MKVLKFGAIWCKECLVMKPMWAEIEEKFPSLETEYFEADECPEKLSEFEVSDIPVFIFLNKDGEEILRLKGAQNREDLEKLVKENLDK